ncbi:uncharacterized protein AMSG_00267 [Thecamonas trahens ATCC 50062]|uniref:Amino acid transporter transmembrane domain-containing protein n=1 Tax=Thecamonas trahens ATCC 50062 TaxID=461836 RepID=A0A0L0D1B7_THETB|nr:hypothetical protein AMSG_00267 [Thecamonas trahens ATCC 50062]KNC46149.1 hypothetical protein AMSG_00267 [Thecamonas trahens ATCC 50062]|eukprot:XP_013763125.1 hypothetical protein AMSG_00267 [Thecamonas trahens ATCC 50062]
MPTYEVPRVTGGTEEVETYSRLVGFGTMINYIIGTGVFSIPFAYYKAGWRLTTICVIIFAFLALVCVFYVVEVLARAEGVLALTDSGKPLLTESSSLVNSGPHAHPHAARGDAEADEYSSAKAGSVAGRGRTESTLDAAGTASEADAAGYPRNRIGYRRFDFVAASRLFGGVRMQVFTQVVMALYCYGVLWSFVAVFASSADTLFFKYALSKDCSIYDDPSHSCQTGYYLWVTAFGIFVVIVSTRDVAEQKWLQMIMTVYRFCAFCVLVISAGVALKYPNTFDPESSSTSAPYISHATEHVKWSGFGTAFTFSAVALNVHYNMPNVIQPITPKRSLLGLTAAGISVAAFCYLLIGALCGMAFGSGVTPLITLNWNSYTGRAGGWGEGHTLWWAYIVKLSVMLFPTLDMLTVYPLICIFTITGLFAFFLELIIPPMLLILSHNYMVSRWGKGSQVTPYSTIFSGRSVAYAVLTIGLLAFAFATYVTIFPDQAAEL